MKDTCAFNITTLLHGENLKGPIEQVMFAERFARSENFRVGILARIDLLKSSTHTLALNTSKTNETLLIGHRNRGGLELHMVIRLQQGSGLHVATGNLLKRSIEIHQEYREAILLQKLTDAEILQIFNYVWDDPGVVQPGPYDLYED